MWERERRRKKSCVMPLDDPGLNRRKEGLIRRCILRGGPGVLEFRSQATYTDSLRVNKLFYKREKAREK